MGEKCTSYHQANTDWLQLSCQFSWWLSDGLTRNLVVLLNRLGREKHDKFSQFLSNEHLSPWLIKSSQFIAFVNITQSILYAIFIEVQICRDDDKTMWPGTRNNINIRVVFRPLKSCTKQTNKQYQHRSLISVITALYSRVDLPSGKLMTLPRLDIVKRELPLKCGKPSLGSLTSLQTFLYQNCVTSWAEVKDDTCMERCSWGRDRRYLVASILGTPGGAQAKVTSLVSRLTLWPGWQVHNFDNGDKLTSW